MEGPKDNFKMSKEELRKFTFKSCARLLDFLDKKYPSAMAVSEIGILVARIRQLYGEDKVDQSIRENMLYIQEVKEGICNICHINKVIPSELICQECLSIANSGLN